MFSVTITKSHWDQALKLTSPFSPNYCGECVISYAVGELFPNDRVYTHDACVLVDEKRFRPESMSDHLLVLKSFDFFPQSIPKCLPITLTYIEDI